MAAFFELEGRLWPEGANATEIAATISKLFGPLTTSRRTTRSASATAMATIDEKPDEEAKPKGLRSLADFAFSPKRSPRRSTADSDDRRAVERKSEERPKGLRSLSEWGRSPKRSAADMDDRRAVGGAQSAMAADAKRQREARAGEFSIQLCRAAGIPCAEPLAEAAVMWGGRGGGASAPRPSESQTRDPCSEDVPPTPLTESVVPTSVSARDLSHDLPLTRSGVSDVMGAIGLA